MAIKGKTKTKSRPKQVARAPRHEPVVMKPPLFARRWLQVTAAMLVGVFAVMVVVWVTNGLRQDSRTKADSAAAQASGATKRTAGLAWQSTVTAAVNEVGTVSPPLPPNLFAPMNAAIKTMKDKGTLPKGAVKTLSDAVTHAQKAVKDLSDFDLTTTISGKGFDVAGAQDFSTSKDELTAALSIYQRAAEMALAAAKGPDSQRKSLTTFAFNLTGDANTQFTKAWSVYESALGDAGIAATPGAGAAGGG
jgi:hypothetical protein